MTGPPAGTGPPTERDRAVLRVGGHECPPGTGGVLGPGRDLARALAAHPRAVVVPMTLGRDPGLAAAAAQTIGWAARGAAPGDLLLAAPLGTTTHLVGWLRAAVARALPGGGDRAALLVAPPGGPEDDAELYKVARLVWRHLRVPWVEVAFLGGEPGVAEGVDRCRRLGARDVVLVPAALVPPPRGAGTGAAGTPLGPAALAALVRRRAAEAEARWLRDGDDGLAAPAHHHDHDHDHHDDHDDDHHHGHDHRRQAPPGHAHGPLPETEETLKEAAAHGR
ncbi:sirohydrochlorin chelatase [Actinomadura rifamycini]|uniref:sirohydrochlorin chelatase n=1 Tax=Actinomadura rifamycini TaxID=31962 RepID=UPI000419ECD6|nr:CbiX/SirB N-terminal domain-containing protein [Actinomadura rifamycini]